VGADLVTDEELWSDLKALLVDKKEWDENLELFLTEIAAMGEAS
jgi:hypothetical protein